MVEDFGREDERCCLRLRFRVYGYRGCKPGDINTHWGNTKVILGSYWGYGKENRNYYLGFRVGGLVRAQQLRFMISWGLGFRV